MDDKTQAVIDELRKLINWVGQDMYGSSGEAVIRYCFERIGKLEQEKEQGK